MFDAWVYLSSENVQVTVLQHTRCALFSIGKLQPALIVLLAHSLVLQQCASTPVSDSRLCAGIKGIWNLRKASSDRFDSYLVLAFVGETRILEINAEDELDEAEIEGFDAEQQVGHSVTTSIGIVNWLQTLLHDGYICIVIIPMWL